MKTQWSHLKHVERVRQGRNYIITLKGFTDKAEVEAFMRHQNETNYVYFPRELAIWEENGEWFLKMSEADSCD